MRTPEQGPRALFKATALAVLTVGAAVAGRGAPEARAQYAGPTPTSTPQPGRTTEQSITIGTPGTPGITVRQTTRIHVYVEQDPQQTVDRTAPRGGFDYGLAYPGWPDAYVTPTATPEPTGSK